MRAAWSFAVGRVAALLALAVAGGLIFGGMTWWLVGVLALALVEQFVNLFRLQRWLRLRSSESPPDLGGVWGDVVALVGELVASEAVPFLPVLRYTDSGLRKRAQWEDTWALQRREDAGEDVGRIPVPPKYQGKDFLKNDFWRLRGGLDVPKERWVSFPGCERGADGSLVVAWAGWDHLQQATALAAYYLDVKDVEGWPAERLQPLLAGLLELVPWLKQWHNTVHPEFGERMGNYYEGFVQDEARAHGFTLDALRAWKPVVVAARRGRRKKA